MGHGEIPHLLAKKKYKGVKNFGNLVDKFFLINLYRFRINDFGRLKDELRLFLMAR